MKIRLCELSLSRGRISAAAESRPFGATFLVHATGYLAKGFAAAHLKDAKRYFAEKPWARDREGERRESWRRRVRTEARGISELKCCHGSHRVIW